MNEWESHFNYPSDQIRGLMVAAQMFGSVIVSTIFIYVVVIVPRPAR
jgi:hypothetical protein